MVGKSFFQENLCLGGVGGGGCLGFCFLGVLGVSFFFGMASSLGPLLVQDTPCPHCFGLYILSGFSRHVKSVHLLVNSIS